jgi:hypothetical protein
MQIFLLMGYKGGERGTYRRLQHRTIANAPQSSRALSLPPTSTRHVHAFRSTASLWSEEVSSQMKCPNLLFVLSVKCTVWLPMTYPYTILLSSIGNRAKKILCPCTYVRACISLFPSTSPSSGIEIVDLRVRTAPWSVADNFSEKGLRIFSFCDAPTEGMSCGTQRMPGTRPKSFFLGLVVGLEDAIATGA